MKKLRVFHFISHFDMGGAERVAASIAQSASPDMEYHIVEMMRGHSRFSEEFITELKTSGIHCHRGWMPDIHFHFLLERITALLFPLWFLPTYLRWRPDVIHAHTELPDLCLTAFCQCFPWLTRHCRIVRTIHNTRLWTGQKRVGRHVERFYQQRKANIAISQSVLQCYEREYQESPPIIYNGVGETAIHKEYDDLKTGKVNVIFAGRMEPQKGIDILMAVVSRLANDDRYHFHIFGDGTLREKVMAGLGPLPNTSIHGPLPHLPAYLPSFDYMLMPSEFEGLSIVAIEASMAGLPNIINSCLGLEETLPSTWPLKVKDNDVEAYIRLFKEVLPHADRQQLGSEAHEYARRNFSLTTMRQRYERFYKEGKTTDDTTGKKEERT